jgi:hypothetical protein
MLNGEQDAQREAQLPLVAAGGGIYIRSFLLGQRKMEAAKARARGMIGQSPVVVVRGCGKTYKAIRKLLMMTAGCCVTVRGVW